VRFLDKDDILEMHAEALAAFGGLAGIRDEGDLESALVAPENRWYYEGADLAACAAAYAYHLTQAHAFLDGNKRVAAIATRTFLLINDVDLLATEDEKYELFIGIAEGRISREKAEEFIRDHLVTVVIIDSDHSQS